MSLVGDRGTDYRQGQDLDYPVAADTTIWLGSQVGLDADGNAVPAAPGLGAFAGVAMQRADNAGGVAGAKVVVVRTKGAFRFKGSGLSASDKGKMAFVVDDETVGISSAGTAVADESLVASPGGTAKLFDGIAANGNIVPGTFAPVVTISATPYTMTDDGKGRLSHASVGKGWIDYESGRWGLICGTAPADVAITASYRKDALPVGKLTHIGSSDAWVLIGG